MLESHLTTRPQEVKMQSHSRTQHIVATHPIKTNIDTCLRLADTQPCEKLCVNSRAGATPCNSREVRTSIYREVQDTGGSKY